MGCPTTITPFCASYLASTRRWKTNSLRLIPPGTASSYLRFLRVGSWIGGDRDGNPFVTAEVLRQALGTQSERALKFYLDEVHLLGGELSLDTRLVTVSDELKDLAERSPDRSPQRRNEPYRLAVSGI
jgi:phosphoenolpyruvate carboxylase